MSNGMRRETGKSSRLPKRMDTLVHAFCNDLEHCSSIRQWVGGFFDEFLDREQKNAMKKTGLRWMPLKGHYVPLESAIAQMLLRLNVEDFDHCIGPCYKEYQSASGQVNNVRTYNSFNTSKYAIELQRQLNTMFLEDTCIPVLLSIALWVDKAPLNKSMTRKATPVMLYIMNDKTRIASSDTS